jgi:hypothetical protein
MIKVLAAELSDQGRLSRGKRYWAEGAVVDIVVGHGTVSAEIQGSRAQPYVVTVEASGGSGVPSKRDVWARCTCPDDTGTGVDLCKHAVAALFALADEVTIEPELVDRWRASSRPPRSVSADEAAVTDLSAARMVRRDDGDDEPDVDPEAGEFDDDADHSDGGGRGADVIELRVRHDPELDVIGRLLQAPAGASPPSFPDVAELDHGVIRNRLLADVLNDALDHLAIRWE